MPESKMQSFPKLLKTFECAFSFFKVCVRGAFQLIAKHLERAESSNTVRYESHFIDDNAQNSDYLKFWRLKVL